MHRLTVGALVMTIAATVLLAPFANAASADAFAVTPRHTWDPKGRCQPTEAPKPLRGVEAVVVHHTAEWRNYAPDAGPRIMRALCALHHRRGFSDIGYHFLVDRYGNVYEGRRGSLEHPHEGAHAQGFNGETIGIAVIGNFEAEAIPKPALDRLEQLLTRIVHRHGIDPLGTVDLVSTGGPLTDHREGTDVTLPTIVGHRGPGRTACPGRHLGKHLPALRERVAERLAIETRPEPMEIAPAPAPVPEPAITDGVAAVVRGLVTGLTNFRGAVPGWR